MNGYVALAGKNSIAFGMLWTLLPGVKKAGSEIKKAAAEYGASSYVALPIEGRPSLIGFLHETALVEKGASKKAACSAAALLTTAFPGIQNAVFGILVSRTKVAFIGFRAGTPLIGFDRIVSLDALEELTADYLRELDDQASTVEFYGTDGVFTGRAATGFDSAWFSKIQGKQLAAARVRRAKGRLVLWLSVLAIGAAAYVGVEMYEAHVKASQQKVKRVMQDPQVLYASSIKEYLASAIVGSVTTEPMTDKINQLPLFHQGWRLERASCTPGACTLSWANTDGGTYRTFASSPLPGLPSVETAYKEGMSILDTSFKFVVEGAPSFVAEDLPTQGNFILYFGSAVQQMKTAGLVIALEKAVVVGLPTTPAGMMPITEAMLKEAVLEGSWRMSGDWTFYQALATLPTNMTVETIDIGVAGDAMSMNVSGKYYVKK